MQNNFVIPIYLEYLFFQNKRPFLAFYLPKLVIVGLIWLASIILASWQEHNEVQDPTYNYRLDASNFLVCLTIATGFMIFEHVRSHFFYLNLQQDFVLNGSSIKKLHLHMITLTFPNVYYIVIPYPTQQFIDFK